MAKPKNIEWVVTGTVTLHGASCIVHAPSRAEAIRKANDLDNIGGIDTASAEVADCNFNACEPNVADE